MPADLDPFHAISISALAQRLKAEGRSIVHMEFGQPSTGAPKAAIAAAHQALDADKLPYWESHPLKVRIARHYQETYGVSVRASQITLTCGASAALVAALSAAFGSGDVIAMARPGYVSYRNTVRALKLTPLEIACGPESRFQLTAEALAAIDPAPKGVILASPANPTGSVIAPDELKAIVEVCRARGIRIVSDEIYHGLTYGERAHSILEYEPGAIVVNTFSK
jgi:aspartate/methionine/tyrosine aminotransferase